MSNDNCGQDPAGRPLREAAQWLVDLQDPHLSQEELLRWNEWQASAPNREAFDSLESIWRVIRSADAHEQSSGSLREEAAYWYFLCADALNASVSDRRE